MILNKQWKPDFHKWYNVEIDAYKFTFELAEKKFEDVLSESESITNKSIKMIIAVSAMFSFYIGFIVRRDICSCFNSLILLMFILDIVGIIFLLFPKMIRGRGISPKILLPKKLDNDEDKGFQTQMLYYSGITILQDNIDYMIEKNTKRAKLYLCCLIFTLVLLIVGSIYLILSF